MKAFLTTIGETTTDLCKRQLEKHGFEVIVMDKKEPWIEKYKDFIRRAAATKEDVLRIDADNIPNRNIAKVPDLADLFPQAYIIQFQLFGFYRYDVFTGGPLVYTKAGLAEAIHHLDKITELRPESSMSRLPSMNPWLVSCPVIMGTHGFFQDKETMARAFENKSKRGQLGHYDFQLASEIIDLIK